MRTVLPGLVAAALALGCAPSALAHGDPAAHAKEATSDYLGFVPENFVCLDTALEQAMRAYYRAYQPDGKRTIRIGATAAVATNEVHRGEHRVWVAVFSDDRASIYYARFKKGVGEEVRSRDLLACDMLMGEAILRAVDDDVDVKLPNNVEFTDFMPALHTHRHRNDRLRRRCVRRVIRQRVAVGDWSHW